VLRCYRGLPLSPVATYVINAVTRVPGTRLRHSVSHGASYYFSSENSHDSTSDTPADVKSTIGVIN
jgi:hypothetical protein